MKIRLLLFVILLVLMTISASAQTLWVLEYYGTYERSIGSRNNTPTWDSWFQTHKGKWGVYNWAQIMPNYRQTYVGPTYQFTDWLEAGIAGGVEQSSNGLARFGSFVSMSKGSNSLFGVYENGASGRWFLAVAKHKFGRYAIGMHAQDYLGVGPRFEVSRGPLTVWTSMLAESETGKFGKNFLAGANWAFFWPGKKKE